MRRLSLALCIVASMLVAGTRAWWCVGHMVIGEIARQNLKYGVEAQADAMFTFLNQWFPQSNNMVSGACWADDLKSNHLDVMAGWHFINQPYNPENVPINPWPIQEINVATAIEKLGQTMRPETLDKENQWIQAYALANIVHFIGDIHQPLHATERYNKNFPNGDRGGNLIHVYWDNKEWPLHFIWDSVCGQYVNTPDRPLSDADYEWIKSLANQFQANFSVPDSEKSVYNSTVMALESFDAAVKYAYWNNSITKGQNLTQEYIDTCKQVAGYRIAYAGYRLAHEINYIFGADSKQKPSAKALLSRVAEIKQEYEAGKKRHF